MKDTFSENELKLISIVIIWVTTMFMVCVGFWITKSPACIWVILIVALLSNSILNNSKDDKKSKAKD